MTERSIFHRIEWQVNVSHVIGLLFLMYVAWRLDLRGLARSRSNGEGGDEEEMAEIIIGD